MSLVAPEELEVLTEAGPEPEPSPSGPEPTDPLLTSVAAFAASAGAGWMTAGVFAGSVAPVVALSAAALGAGLVALSYRMRRPAVLQYAALPAALAGGALWVVPDATGGSANLPGLVAEAVRTGGVSQPPVPFDPGWRFILFVLIAVLATAAASVASGLERPKLAVFIPVPVLFAAALVQPEEGALVTSAVALALAVGGLAVAYGVELAREGATSGSFEIRRLGRGVGMVVLLVAALVGLSRAGFLFPEPQRDQVIPPKRPETQPPQADRVLFTVTADRPGPWRMGVLDVYETEAWLLPPYDTRRFLEVPPGGRLSEEPDPARDTFTARFDVVDVEGHVLPTIAEAHSVSRRGIDMSWDPRTQMLRLTASRARRGMSYTLQAPAPPSGDEMSEAGEPPPQVREFLEAPTPPNEVVLLLEEAPSDASAFDRLQFVRTEFYDRVVAAGAGDPVDVPPDRVAEMLEGREATPYEITAAEALLARWAGIPSRIGYGFHGGISGGGEGERRWEVRPRHGATWLEVYFDGFGWVPVVGTPPRARATLRETQREDPDVRPTEELALVVFVPVRLQSIRLLYEVVRYWVLVVVPVLAGLGFAGTFYTAPLKLLRRARRRRWARRRGPRERIAVAYAELRDVASDLNVGDPTATPLAFTASVAPDPEHNELAWVVTRALWGDLRRDLRPGDVEAAEDMSRSVTRRLRRAQPAVTRLLGAAARASLRDPFTREVPNLWPSRSLRLRLGVRSLRRLLPVGGVLTTAVLLLATGCVRAEVVIPLEHLEEHVMPDPIAPPSLEGYVFQREEGAEAAFDRAGDASIVAEGRVYTIRSEDTVQGALQVAALLPGLTASERELRTGILGAIGGGRFDPTRVGTERFWVQRTPEQRILLWFAPGYEYYQILVVRPGFEESDRLFAALLAYQRGEEPGAAFRAAPAGTVDVRRGGPE